MKMVSLLFVCVGLFGRVEDVVVNEAIVSSFFLLCASHCIIGCAVS